MAEAERPADPAVSGEEPGSGPARSPDGAVDGVARGAGAGGAGHGRVPGEAPGVAPGAVPGVVHDHPSEAVLAEVPDGIVVVDDEGMIRLCNPAAAALFGRPAGELLHLPFGFPVTSGRGTEIDLVPPAAGPGRVVEMRVTETHALGERVYIATLRDITERHRAQRALEAELDRQGTMIAVTAHELRTPLATIGVLAHTLRDTGPHLTDAQREDIVHRIIDSTERLRALVRKHLAAARIDAEATDTAPLPVPVLEFVLEHLGQLGEDAPQVDVDCPPDVEAYVDRGDLWEMLANYLENAFTHGRPPVSVSVTPAPAPGDDIVLRVHDDGPGVPPPAVPDLFQRFARGTGPRRGTGLGLWIVRRLARAAGGDAWYEAGQADAGPAFCLRLRRAPEEPGQRRRTPQES
ncbi:ATP-binding protein [Streptomyces sp. NPDC059639]|uniref:PAS domain-containing sensor histidine kinase n=1 Tax=Streptomyces sp. NPDC059639 TaxID=3346891 RepID=UPI0036B6DF24